MIKADKRRAIHLLHTEGMSERELSRRFSLSRNTVRAIIKEKGAMPTIERKQKDIDHELLKRLYDECDGFAQRVHEKLTEEEGIEIEYSTLTRKLRKLGISKPAKSRCDRVPDKPGEEMQHDTSSYVTRLSCKRTAVIGSLIYLRYSKRRYLKFYRSFNRFRMKSFFHEALMFWGYCAENCIIDNTNLARLRGTGANAVIAPEMERFARQYGFQYHCHAIGHSNRKAGEERSFRIVETNFFPGRTFENLEDLNRQALEWSTTRLDNKGQGKVKLIPAKVFEYESAFLRKVPEHIPEPYLSHNRDIDQYGYIAFAGNYYWIPEKEPHLRNVMILEYADHITIYQNRTCMAQYSLPAYGLRNKTFSPEGEPKPRYQPNNRKKPTQEEENRLRAMAGSINDYLDFALKGKGKQRHRFIRKLYALSRKLTPALFIASIERAYKYGILNIDVIERIAVLQMTQAESSLPFAQVDENYRERESYQEGRLTDHPDFSIYKHDGQEDKDE